MKKQMTTNEFEKKAAKYYEKKSRELRKNAMEITFVGIVVSLLLFAGLFVWWYKFTTLDTMYLIGYMVIWSPILTTPALFLWHYAKMYYAYGIADLETRINKAKMKVSFID